MKRKMAGDVYTDNLLNDKFNIKSNQGITLVALIVTIIVLLILAVVTIKILTNAGVIGKANEATIMQELKQVQEQVKLRITDEKLNKLEKSEKFNISDYTNLESFNPKIESKYSEYIRIENGEIYLITTTPENIKNVASKIGIAQRERITNARIYGNSIQDGIPVPENPIEVQSVGDLVTDIEDSNYGKYKIPIIARGKNIIDKNEINCSGWTFGVFSNEWIINNLKPDTTYTISYDVECISVPEYDEKAAGNLGLYIMGKSNIALLENKYLNAGEKISIVKTFNTPSDILDSGAGYRIIGYTNRYIKDGTPVFGRMIFKNIQLEEGDTATEYEPYKSNETNIYLDEPLRKVGDVADYIDLAKGKVVRSVREKVFDGTENWNRQSATHTNIINLFLNMQDWGAPKKKKEMYCTIAKYSSVYIGTSNDTEANVCAPNAPGSNFLIDFDLAEFPDVVDFKNYLSNQATNGEPIKVYYQLVTPIEENVETSITIRGDVNIRTQIQPSKIDYLE